VILFCSLLLYHRRRRPWGLHLPCDLTYHA
jgi:hypothetical protein